MKTGGKFGTTRKHGWTMAAVELAVRQGREYGNISLEERDNRLTAENPPSFERRSNNVVYEEISPRLHQLDITHNLPDWSVVHDERWDEASLAKREEHELWVMGIVDQALDQIVADGHDIHHRIDEELRTWAKYLALLAERRRTEYGLPLFTEGDIIKDAREVWWADHLHWWHERKSGGAYVRKHVLPVEERMILLTGMVGRRSRTAAKRHDDPEDLPKAPIPLTPLHAHGIERHLLICTPYLEEYRREDAERVEQTMNEIALLVDAVTKMKSLKENPGEKREEEALQAALKLLSATVEGGARAFAIKGPDRDCNLEDNDTNPSAVARQEIPYLSAMIYGRFARVFELHKLCESMIRRCFQILNSRAIDRFNRIQRRRLDHYLGKNKEKNPIRKKLEELKSNPHIKYIGIHPTPFAAYAEPTEILNLKYTPEVGPADPMFEIYIELRPCADEEKEEVLIGVRDQVLQTLRAPLSKAGTEKTGYSGLEGGWIHVFNPDLFRSEQEKTTLRVRINDPRSEALRTRGKLQEESIRDPQITAPLARVLKAQHRTLKEFLDALDEETLRREIKIKTPKNETRSLRQGARGADYIASIHAEMFLDFRGLLQLSGEDEDPRVKGKELSPFKPLEDGSRVLIVTSKHRDIRISKKFPFGVAWAYFVGSHGQDQIHRALLKQAELKATREEKQKVRTFRVETGGKFIEGPDKKAISHGRENILEKMGANHVGEIGSLLGITPPRLLVEELLRVENKGGIVNRCQKMRAHHLRMLNEKSELEKRGGAEDEIQRATGRIQTAEEMYLASLGEMSGHATKLHRSIGTGRVQTIEAFADKRLKENQAPIEVKITTPNVPKASAPINNILGEHRMNIVGNMDNEPKGKTHSRLTYRIRPYGQAGGRDLIRALIRIRREVGYPVRIASDHFQHKPVSSGRIDTLPPVPTANLGH